MWISLLKEYHFDLHAWFAGDVKSSPAAVLAMVRHLPEGTPLMARLSAQAQAERNELQRRKDAGEDVELPEPAELPEVERLYQEKQTWTTVPTLLATLINRASQGIEGMADPTSRPGWPVIGPEDWWPEAQKKKNQPDADEEVVDGVKPSRLTRHFGMTKGG